MGRNHALFITQGELFAVGINAFGVLGLPGTSNTSTPIQVGVKTDWVQVKAGEGHNIALDAQGNVFAWGVGYFGRMADLGIEDQPIQVTSVGDTISKIDVGESFTVIKTTGNDLKAVGRNNLGHLGRGSVVTSSENMFAPVINLSNVSSFSVGLEHGLAVSSGNLYAWGSDGFGQLGSNTISDHTTTPVLINDTQVWSEVVAGAHHSFAITTGGQVYAWGKNTKGQLCESGLMMKVDVPTMLSSLPGTVSQISAGYEHSMILFDNGDVYVGGSNVEEQGTVNSESGLDLIPEFQFAESIEAGAYNSSAIFSDNVMMKGRFFNATTYSVPQVIAN